MNAKLKWVLITSLLYASATSTLFSQSITLNQFPEQSEPGKCYVKVKTPSISETFTYAIYTGDLQPDDCDYVEEIEFWYDLVSSPDTLTVVWDTSQTSEYVWETFTATYWDRTLPRSTWKEIYCSKKIPPKLLEKLANRLWEFGYYTLTLKEIDYEEVHAALVSYQRDNGLSEGLLFIETLDHLKIDYQSR